MTNINNSDEQIRKAMEFAYDRGRRDTIDVLHRHSESRNISMRMINPYSIDVTEGERWMVKCRSRGCGEIIDESKTNFNRPSRFPIKNIQWWKDTNITAYCPKHWYRMDNGKIMPKKETGE